VVIGHWFGLKGGQIAIDDPLSHSDELADGLSAKVAFANAPLNPGRAQRIHCTGFLQLIGKVSPMHPFENANGPTRIKIAAHAEFQT